MSTVTDRLRDALVIGDEQRRGETIRHALLVGDIERQRLYQTNQYFRQWLDGHIAEWVRLAGHAARRFGRVGSQRYDDTIDCYADALAYLVEQAEVDGRHQAERIAALTLDLSRPLITNEMLAQDWLATSD